MSKKYNINPIKDFDLTETNGTVAPVGATYVTISSNTSLTNERVLTAGEGINLTDGGANSTITIDALKAIQYNWACI